MECRYAHALSFTGGDRVTRLGRAEPVTGTRTERRSPRPDGVISSQILVPLANATEAADGDDSWRRMSSDIIISYDGTPNDDDALVLGRLLGASGTRLALAYVRHSREYDPGREQLAEHDAARRLEQGAAWLEQPDIARHVVLSASTGEGLAQLA